MCSASCLPARGRILCKARLKGIGLFGDFYFLMKFYSHESRYKVWTVVFGLVWVVLDVIGRQVCAGDVIGMPAGVEYTVFAGVLALDC